MLAPSIAKGATIIKIKGIVIKDIPAVIAVKETDNAIFPLTNLVIQLEVTALGTHVIKIIPNLKKSSTGRKIANKNPIHGKITIYDNRPINKILIS